MLTPRQLAVMSGAQLLPSMAAPSPKLIVCAAASDGAVSARIIRIDFPQTIFVSQPMNLPMVKGLGGQKVLLSHCSLSIMLSVRQAGRRHQPTRAIRGQLSNSETTRLCV